ncbi:hypothetical protein TNCV_1747531 [Trichonephila clavipes]|nr:hypothetical protein TNCV_1747531 [Trichonephila clavipes]
MLTRSSCPGYEMYEEKEEITVDVMKYKNDLNPVILSKERMDFDEDEIEEETPKLPERKLKKLSRMTVAKLQHAPCLKHHGTYTPALEFWARIFAQ